jgi:hypothetical protein
MTTHTVPADVEPDSIIDLVDDCREVSGMLAPFVIDLTDIPVQAGVKPFAIPAQTADRLEGFEDYGS